MSATQSSPPTSPSPATTNITPKSSVSTNGKSHRRNRRTSIRQQHALLMLLIFLPLLAIQTYSAFDEYETQRQAILQGQAATARSVSRTITAFINDQLGNNRAISFNFDGSQNLTTEQGNSLLARFRQSTPTINSYQFLNSEGLALYSDPPALVGFNFGQEPFIKLILSGAEEYTISDLGLSTLDNTTPTFAVANVVYDANNNRIGVMRASVNANLLGQVIDIKLGQRGRGSISIHDRQTQLIYNSQFPTMDYARRVSNTATTSVRAALNGKETLQEYVKSPLDGLEKMGASTPVRLPSWSASVAEPIEDAMSPAMSLIVTRSILFGVVTIIAGIAAWLYSRYLTRPISQLSKAAVALGEGQLDYRAPVTTRTTELAQLGLSFNQMADKIAEDTRAKDAFLSQAAHELKTPITVIKGSTQLLITRQQKDLKTIEDKSDGTTAVKVKLQNQIKTLRSVEHQTNRMIELINRLLELGRHQTGQVQYNFEAVNFAELVSQGIEVAHQLITPERHSIELVTESEKSALGWDIMGDVARLEQVILNLLENAIKYSPEGGAIKVDLRHIQADEILGVPRLELSVKDYGLGLESTDLDRLFERYYRAGNVGANISGLGLGLYISYEIVRQHKGQLWAESPGLDKGSTFHLVLPLKTI